MVDDVFLVLNADLPSLRNAKRLLPWLGSGSEAEDDRLRVVLNRVGDQSEITESDVRSALDLPVAFSLRQDDAHVIRSINVGEPLVMNGIRSKYGADVKELGLDLARLVNPDAAERDNGLIKRLMDRVGSSGRGE
jgi:Flp pilus assembly CpaE family ATPase